MESPNPRPLRALLEINKIFHQVELIYILLFTEPKLMASSLPLCHTHSDMEGDQQACNACVNTGAAMVAHTQEQSATATTTHRWCACKVELKPSPLPPLDTSPARTVDRTVQTHALPEAAPTA